MADDEVGDDLVDVVVHDANRGEVVTTDVKVEDEWMIDFVDVIQYDVVNDGVITLKDVANLLSIIEVRSIDDELEDVTDEWVCPVVEVLLLEDAVIEDDVDVF